MTTRNRPVGPIIELVELGFPWLGLDPFIFTVHHVDNYPEGDDLLGPAAPLDGRRLGADFSALDGWSMYHGDVVPGFPQHPHRGFETVTVVRRGYVDHSDSLGATARYGEGDVQWLTTGAGIMHAEMFPLIETDRPNPLELFQIWLNLPPESKMVPAYFGMLWGEDLPTLSPAPGVEIELVAGSINGEKLPSPPPDSWASRHDSHLAIWVVKLGSDAQWFLPATATGVNRMLHCFQGDDVEIASTRFGSGIGVKFNPDSPAMIVNHGSPAQFLLLQGMPIGAPVFQMGPFVMNTPEELRQAVEDYRRTQFGGWPWSTRSPVHHRSEGRFAIHADGRVERRSRESRSATAIR